MAKQQLTTTATAIATLRQQQLQATKAIANQPKRCKCVRQNSLGIDVTATTITPIAATDLNWARREKQNALGNIYQTIDYYGFFVKFIS